MEPIRIIIADDHILFRDGLRSLLLTDKRYELVAEVETGDDCLRLATELQPDLILMDIQMPGMDGVEATRKIVQTSPHIKILIVSMFEDSSLIFSAMKAGAQGYIVKGASHEEMLRAISGVTNGEAIFSPSIAVHLKHFFNTMKPLELPPVFPQLTNREREILDLLTQGFKTDKISSKLYLSPKTVRNHISNILNKLQVSDRSEAIIKAKEAGLGN